MGADIFLNSKYKENERKWEPVFKEAVQKRDSLKSKKAKDRAQKKVTEAYNKMYSIGYYRDSYNGTSLLNVLGLSWWRDVGEMLDASGYLPIEQATLFRKMVSDAKTREITEEWLRSEHCQIDSENSVESWKEFFENKRKDLLSLLDESIEKNEPLYCSI